MNPTKCLATVSEDLSIRQCLRFVRRESVILLLPRGTPPCPLSLPTCPSVEFTIGYSCSHSFLSFSSLSHRGIYIPCGEKFDLLWISAGARVHRERQFVPLNMSLKYAGRFSGCLESNATHRQRLHKFMPDIKVHAAKTTVMLTERCEYRMIRDYKLIFFSIIK